jgi:hypothetical protein
MQVAPTAISVAPVQREAGMNLFLTQMTFQSGGANTLARAVAVEADMRDIDFSMGVLVKAPYRHSILVQSVIPPHAAWVRNFVRFLHGQISTVGHDFY